ncbi:MAG: hypothetical protein LBS84_09775 [Clostridiales bacterium]|jgi:hypothetical protein|nr:hypothetical protein [Clostridiales bacterium]
MARSRLLCEAGIAIRIDPSVKRGGAIRINWPAYLEFIRGYPALPDHKRLRSVPALVEQVKTKRAR